MPPLLDSTLVLETYVKLGRNNFANIYRIYGRFTMETILAIAFGRIVEIQKGDSDEIVEVAREIFQSSDEKNSVSIAIIIPLISQSMLTIA